MDKEMFRKLARLIAWVRVGIGIVAVTTRSLVLRPWVGEVGDDVPARMLARTMGGRGLVLGLGTLRALSVSDAEGRSWVALSGIADTVDAVASIVAVSYTHLTLPTNREV